MENSKHLEVNHAKRGKIQYWTLTNLGYEAIEDLLPPLKEKGFKSESPIHDLYTNAIQLADYNFLIQNKIKVYTEQELRRIDLASYPTIIPRTDRHRPDGYWVLNSENKTELISIELELSQKSNDSYESTGDFYSDYEQIKQILWIVSRKGMIPGMKANLNKSHNSNGLCHNFILLTDFFKNGWQTKILDGISAGKTVYQLLGKHEENFEQTFSYKYILDTRKFPRISRACLSKDISSYSNWVPSETILENTYD